MVKGEDIERRKKNKSLRKKLNKETSVSSRVAAIIAAKKRRQGGKRRQCQGMCFTLPTPEDPYNDRQGKPVEEYKGKKNPLKRKKDDKEGIDGKGSKGMKVVESDEELQMAASTDKKLKKLAKLGTNGKQLEEEDNVPSKFLVLCLKFIQDALLLDGGMNVEDSTSLFANPWGVKFLKSYSMGKNILETSGDSPNLQQIAWMVSAAADAFARKENEGEYFASPFLLYLVPSQEHATKVRSVCKPLKALGIHTVSLHPGALIDTQRDGLKSCEPEFLVATPARLWELISLKAIDISGVLLLVVDGMDMFTESGCQDVVKRISQSVSKSSRAVVFQGHSTVQTLNRIITVRQPFYKLSLDDAVRNKQARKLKSMHSYTLEEGKH